ncbi:MAG: sulfatase [Armatimonadota bacterium]|nr:sulfatase [Armatimonadota bacterium]
MTHKALSRRDFLALMGSASAAIAAGDCFQPLLGDVEGFTSGGRKPNIGVIVADDLGYGELGCYGHKEIPTPNIDSIAKNGVKFTNGYVSCPVCSPTRAGLITGRYQQRFGHEQNPGPPPNHDPRFGLPRSETTIADRLKSAGYTTGCVGKWHLGFDAGLLPMDRGFDEFFGHLAGGHPYLPTKIPPRQGPIMRGNFAVEEKEYLTDAFGREASAFIDKHHDKPFFLYLAFNAVHAPLQSTDKYLERFPKIENVKRRKFAAMLSAMDDAVGKTLDALRRNNIEENTLVFFIGDNGGPTGATTCGNGPLKGVKGQLDEGGIRVPFLMQYKGHAPAGKTYDKPVIALDITPTSLALAGGKSSDARFDGVNLMPYLTGKSKGVPHETLYWRFSPQWAIRKGDWKLLNMSGGKDVQLYNLAIDIGEQTDLAAQKPDKVKELQADYDKWNSTLATPLWGYGAPPIPGRKKANEDESE